MIKLVAVCFLVCLLHETYARKKCPNLATLQPKNNFKEDKFLGTYFQYRWYWPAFANANNLFDAVNITFYRVPGQDDIVYKRIDKRIDPSDDCAVDLIIYHKESPEGVYRFYLSYVPYNNSRTVVVHTDYENYALMYHCLQQVGTTCTNHMVEFLTRDAVVDPSLISDVVAKLNKICYPHMNDYGDLDNTNGCPED